MVTILLILYIIGLISSLYKNIKIYKILKLSKKEISKIVTQERHPLLHIFLDAVFWPYLIIKYKSPLAVISELFFKNYGNHSSSAFKSEGIKNFYMDLLHKKKYEKLKARKKIIKINKESPAYISFIQSGIFTDGSSLFVGIIFSKIGDRYLIKGTYFEDENHFSCRHITRFALYRCKNLSKKSFIEAADKLHSNLGESLVRELNSG